MAATNALSRDFMLDRMRHRDGAYDRRFLFGVLTTGIYCRPSCGARRARPENVDFFRTPDAAEKAGLRPCKRCRPDLFLRGEDPDEALADGLAERLRTAPEGVRDVGEMARRAGVGTSKLHQLCRRFFHATPAELLARARVELVCRRLLSTAETVSDLAFDAGFESLSVFNAQFKERVRLSPRAYRRLATDDAFELQLPSYFAVDRALRYLGRDPASLLQRVDGDRVRFAMAHAGGTAIVHAELRRGGARGLARCAWQVATPAAEPWGPAVHRRLLRLLGLGADPRPFERRLDGPLARLVGGQRGLTIPQTHDLVDALVWVVVGQQVSLASAFAMRRDLLAQHGRPVADGLSLPPTLETLAGLDVDQLKAARFSGRKAEYLIEIARQAVAGELDLAALEQASAPAVERRLLALRGLGPWSVHYLMMRGLGFADCVPVGDVALAESLKRFFDLAERPGPERVRELMTPFAPYRSLATFHLWNRLGDTP